MPRKVANYKEIINLSVFSFGISCASVLLTADMSSLYKFLGASSSYLPLLSLAGPVAGLFVQPIIGQLSDDTLSIYGKRRPYIFVWAIATALSCFVLSFASSLWSAVLAGWLFSCSINGCMEALRALTGDVIDNRQKAKAFSMQTIFGGIGAGFTALLPYIFENYISKSKEDLSLNQVPFHMKASFVFAGLIMILTMVWLMYKVKEKKPNRTQLLENIKKKANRDIKKTFIKFFKEIFKNIKKMPHIMKQFIYIQIFTWMGMFGMWLYFSLALSQHLYGLPPIADMADAQNMAALSQGTVKTGLYFSIYQYVSVAYAIMLPILVDKFEQKIVHAVSLIVGAAGLILLGITHSDIVMMACMVAVGIMWGSITVLPYSIVTAELPRTKMGIYLGIFNISITLPQILAGFLLQPIYSYVFSQHAIYMMMLSGLLILIAGMLTLYQFSNFKGMLNNFFPDFFFASPKASRKS